MPAAGMRDGHGTTTLEWSFATHTRLLEPAAALLVCVLLTDLLCLCLNLCLCHIRGCSSSVASACAGCVFGVLPLSIGCNEPANEMHGTLAVVELKHVAEHFARGCTVPLCLALPDPRLGFNAWLWILPCRQHPKRQLACATNAIRKT